MRKIAIVNRTNLKNYGSVLQCYALCEAVEGLGYKAEVVWEKGTISRNYDFRIRKILKIVFKMVIHPSLAIGVLKSFREVQKKPISDGMQKKFDIFVREHIAQKFFSSKLISKTAKRDEYEKFICGSDQVWCSTSMYVDPLMYLRFAPKEKRIAYAPSIGRNYIPNYNRSQMKRYINEIPFVSIREDEGKRLIKELTGRNVPVVLDPVLILEKKKWETLACSESIPKSKYGVLYFLDEPSKSNQEQIIEFLKKNNLDAFAIGQQTTVIEKKLKLHTPTCGPKDFLSLIKNAEVVITDSYHGMLFSIIFEKCFWSVEREYQQYDQSSRQISILKKLNLEKRYVKTCECLSMQKLDFGAINYTLKILREESLNYLRTALKE